ncbi:MAG: hypothetical protein IPI67_06275 [Myxococcales bacterium]|nr:hypothetical protein [Myxococcales bacterium]
MPTPPPPLPEGSEQVAAWARGRRMKFEAWPDQSWFSAWEPFDTMVGAEAWFNSASWSVPPGGATIAEPWQAPLDSEPVDRTLLLFVSHPSFVRRAAARGGEHFNTRVAYLENPPMPTVQIGDPSWDSNMLTLAASPSEAAAAFPPGARRLLSGWGFTGHIEIRPGGLVVHFAGTKPIPAHLDRLVHAVGPLVKELGR